MGTSLTPEFWERFILLLFAAMGVTIVLTAFFDALALRVARRRAQMPPTPPTAQVRESRPAAKDRRTPVGH
ncbi:hypothetical protein OIE43_43550 [Streptomyces pseudovenezuelae]|uniref:Uncharacterized protein n=1 Tax=Streptomyces pseudovenezuelae TaxID=67350 RepID=A0ABZ1X9H7_9ACTN|nr:hypothetical protein [Streptomyces pseudovenezuelae]